MGKIVLFLGLVTSAAIFAVALIGAPGSGGVAAREAQAASATGCHTEEIAVDEGYGVTRKTSHLVCTGVE
jgi:hypothetical protein